MTRTRLAIAIATLALAAGPAFAQVSIDKVNGSITAESGERYGNLETVNGSIRLEDDAVLESASTVNGSIKGGDSVQARSLETVNGGIRLGERAKVARGLETVNGSVFVDSGSTVGGDISTVNGAIGIVDTDLGGDIETVRADADGDVAAHRDRAGRGGRRAAGVRARGQALRAQFRPDRQGDRRHRHRLLDPDPAGRVLTRQVR